MKTTRNSRSGFTLIEVIAVLVLLGILAAVAVPRYIDVTEAAADRAIDAAIAELNGREALAWSNEMLENNGSEVDDTVVLGLVLVPALADALGDDYELTETTPGTDYTISFQERDAVDVTREQATTESPGRWQR